MGAGRLVVVLVLGLTAACDDEERAWPVTRTPGTDAPTVEARRDLEDAIGAAAAGNEQEAADRYARLAAAHPNNWFLAEAARVHRARARSARLE